MKSKLFLTSIAAVLLCSATACSFAAENNVALYGSASTATAANSTIVIEPGTNHVTVTKGDVVKFVCGDKTFAWHFNDVSTLSEIDLNDIAPPGALTHAVKVYLRRNPTTDGG